MAERRLRICPGLVFTVGDNGIAAVWHPVRRVRVGLEPEQLTLLARFGRGATSAEAADAAGYELDGALLDLIAELERAELLLEDVPLPPEPPPRPIAQQRIAEIVDPGSFVEHAAGPIITGEGQVGGRRVAIAAWQPGAPDGIEDVLVLQERVAREPCPVVYLLDDFSIGRRRSDFSSPRGVGRIFANQGRLSRRVPQVAVVYGPLWRPAAFLPAACDFVVMIEGGAFVFLGDPNAVKEFTGEVITADELGSARVHSQRSGLAHLVAKSAADAAAMVRRYLAFFPSEVGAPLPTHASVPAPINAPTVLAALVPDAAETPFPIGEVARAFLDEGSLFEVRDAWARELSTTLARLDGQPVGVIANCSQHRAGVLTIEATDKATQFVELCDRYQLPIVFLVDVLGFTIGSAAERAGIERAAARLFAALAIATTKKIVVVVRRAHTAGLFGMCGPTFDPDLFLALPTAAISVVTERGLINGLPKLERQLDTTTRAAIRRWLRDQRPDPATLAEVVPLGQLRARLCK